MLFSRNNSREPSDARKRKENQRLDGTVFNTNNNHNHTKNPHKNSIIQNNKKIDFHNNIPEIEISSSKPFKTPHEDIKYKDLLTNENTKNICKDYEEHLPKNHDINETKVHFGNYVSEKIIRRNIHRKKPTRKIKMSLYREPLKVSERFSALSEKEDDGRGDSAMKECVLNHHCIFQPKQSQRHGCKEEVERNEECKSEDYEEIKENKVAFKDVSGTKIPHGKECLERKSSKTSLRRLESGSESGCSEVLEVSRSQSDLMSNHVNSKSCESMVCSREDQEGCVIEAMPRRHQSKQRGCDNSSYNNSCNNYNYCSNEHCNNYSNNCCNERTNFKHLCDDLHKHHYKNNRRYNGQYCNNDSNKQHYNKNNNDNYNQHYNNSNNDNYKQHSKQHYNNSNNDNYKQHSIQHYNNSNNDNNKQHYNNSNNSKKPSEKISGNENAAKSMENYVEYNDNRKSRKKKNSMEPFKRKDHSPGLESKYEKDFNQNHVLSQDMLYRDSEENGLLEAVRKVSTDGYLDEIMLPNKTEKMKRGKASYSEQSIEPHKDLLYHEGLSETTHDDRLTSNESSLTKDTSGSSLGKNEKERRINSKHIFSSDMLDSKLDNSYKKSSFLRERKISNEKMIEQEVIKPKPELKKPNPRNETSLKRNIFKIDTNLRVPKDNKMNDKVLLKVNKLSNNKTMNYKMKESEESSKEATSKDSSNKKPLKHVPTNQISVTPDSSGKKPHVIQRLKKTDKLGVSKDAHLAKKRLEVRVTPPKVKIMDKVVEVDIVSRDYQQLHSMMDTMLAKREFKHHLVAKKLTTDPESMVDKDFLSLDDTLELMHDLRDRKEKKCVAIENSKQFINISMSNRQCSDRSDSDNSGEDEMEVCQRDLENSKEYIAKLKGYRKMKMGKYLEEKKAMSIRNKKVMIEKLEHLKDIEEKRLERQEQQGTQTHELPCVKSSFTQTHEPQAAKRSSLEKANKKNKSSRKDKRSYKKIQNQAAKQDKESEERDKENNERDKESNERDTESKKRDKENKKRDNESNKRDIERKERDKENTAISSIKSKSENWHYNHDHTNLPRKFLDFWAKPLDLSSQTICYPESLNMAGLKGAITSNTNNCAENQISSCPIDEDSSQNTSASMNCHQRTAIHSSSSQSSCDWLSIYRATPKSS